MKVTGSTIYTALGCDGLKRQREHYDKEMNGIEPPARSETQIQAMQHGTDSERHQIATMTGIIMPLLYPDLIFHEEGYYVLGKTMVSPDGSLRSNDNSVKYAFEAKAPVPKNFAPTLHEQVPDRYITQPLYEQKAMEAAGTLYMSWTDESCTLFKVLPDETACEEIANLIDDVYLAENPRRPTRLSSESKQLKSNLSEVGKRCVFLGEFPSVMGINDSVTDDDSSSAYSTPKLQNSSTSSITYDDLQRHLLLGLEILNEAYEIQRVMASQVVVYLLSDIDRFWKDEEPHAIPVLYFYRGYSLSMDIARNITEKCKEVCRSNGMDVIACAADGEFTPLIVRGRKDNPLTQHQLSKDVWKEVGHMTKSDIVKLFIDYAVPPELHISMQEDNAGGNCVRMLTSKSGSIDRVRTPRRGWSQQNVTTNGETDHVEEAANTESASNLIELSENDDESAATQLISDVTISDIPNVESENTNETEHMPDNVEVVPCVVNTVNVIEEIDDESIANIPNIDIGETNNKEQHHDGKLVSVSEISAALVNLNKDKWSNKSDADIMQYFETGETLKTLNMKELIEIAKCINDKKEKKYRLKISGLKKHNLVNQISDVLCDGSKVTERVLNRKRHIPSLKVTAQRVIMKKSYPKKVLSIAYSNFIWPDKLRQWKSEARVNSTLNVKGVDENFSPYYVPDRSEKDDFEVFVYDKTHLGSNLRKCICLNRVSGISKSAWHRVSEINADILNPTLLEVTDEGKIIDQMKERFARNMVSEDVERQMRVNGHKVEAEFCNVVREGLYSADDIPGIPATDRCYKRLRLIDWLADGTDFGNFPPYGATIKGLSTISYEGLRSSSEAKLYLYALAKKGTYNVRAPNTLCSESFFSTMQEMDPWGQGVLTSDGVEKHISDFTTITALKMKEDRPFYIQTKKDAAYPTQSMSTGPLDKDGTSHLDEHPPCQCRVNRYITCIVPRNHFFDTAERARRHRQHKVYKFPDINQPARGEQPVRVQYGYRINETKVLPSKRLGINVNNVV